MTSINENQPERNREDLQGAEAVEQTQPTAASIEQTQAGTRQPAEIVANFDGLGEGFEEPQGKGRFRNPSDNSLAVGPNHIVQFVNSHMAVFTKAGEKFDTTRKVSLRPGPHQQCISRLCRRKRGGE